MMAWTHDQVVLHLTYLVEEGIVHLFHARTGKIDTAAVAHEEAVPREGVPRNQIAAGVGRVARRMDDLHLQLSHLDDHAVLKDEVLSNAAESMGGDLRAGLVGEPFVVKHVIRVMVRVEDEPDRVPVLSGDLLQDAGVEARIDHDRDLGRGIPDHITEVLHRADHVLFEEHRPPEKPTDRVKRSFRSKGSRPWLFGEGRVEPRARTTLARHIERGGYGGTVRNRVVLGFPCSGRSHATSTCVLPPYPLRRHRLLGTCGYRSSPSSKTAHRKSFPRDPTRSGFCSSFPIRKGSRTRMAKPHSVDFRPLRSDAGSWHPSRAGLRRRTRT